jgi:hypothetical protein
MDGSLARQRLQGRNITLVTTSFAISTLPDWIYALATYGPSGPGQPAARVDQYRDSLGHIIIYMYKDRGTSPGDFIWLLNPDFSLCKQIANNLTIPFSEPKSITLARIAAQVAVSFAGRPG